MAENVLPVRKRRFVEALLGGATQGQCAVLLGVSDRQARRYMTDPQVRRALAQGQDLAIEHVARKAAQTMTEALDTLSAITRDGSCSDTARVSAARAVLEAGLRFRELVDLASHVTALEEATSEQP